MDCMNHHDYDRDKCLDYFQAYRDCKKAWVSPRMPGCCLVSVLTFTRRWHSGRQTA